MQWEPKPDSPAALDDEAEHKRFIARCAKDLAANEWAPPPPAPRAPGLTEKDLDRRLSKLCATIGKAVRQLVVEPLQKKIAELEQKQLKLGGVWKAGERYKENTVEAYGSP
jgi:hypothetical protein